MVVSCFDYSDPLIRLILWRLKYHGNKELALFLGKRASEVLIEELDEWANLTEFNNPLVLAVPVSKRRLRKRGFNQAALVAKSVAEELEFEFREDYLVKGRETISQVKLKSKQERLTNLVGAFFVLNKQKLVHRNVILIDDVYTSGATVRECTKTLQAAGARKVFTLTIAR